MYGLRRKKKVFHYRQKTLKNFEQCRNKKKSWTNFSNKIFVKTERKKEARRIHPPLWKGTLNFGRCSDKKKLSSPWEQTKWISKFICSSWTHCSRKLSQKTKPKLRRPNTELTSLLLFAKNKHTKWSIPNFYILIIKKYIRFENSGISRKKDPAVPHRRVIGKAKLM